MCLKDYGLALISKALVQIVNFESVVVQVTISMTGLQASIDMLRSTATVLTSSNVIVMVVVVGSRDWGGREGLLCYSTRGATVPAGTVHSSATARG